MSSLCISYDEKCTIVTVLIIYVYVSPAKLVLEFAPCESSWCVRTDTDIQSQTTEVDISDPVPLELGPQLGLTQLPVIKKS